MDGGSWWQTNLNEPNRPSLGQGPLTLTKFECATGTGTPQ